MRRGDRGRRAGYIKELIAPIKKAIGNENDPTSASVLNVKAGVETVSSAFGGVSVVGLYDIASGEVKFLIETARFRREAEFVFEKYNNFAKTHSKYHKFDDCELNEYSKQLQSARNTVHGPQKKPADKENAEFAVALCIVGLYIYILEKSGASSACIFNFIQCFYP